MPQSQSGQPPCVYRPGFLSREKATKFLEDVMNGVERKQYPITLFGKTYMQPRLVGFQGDPGITYTYSKTTMYASGWHPGVLQLKDRLERETGYAFNSVLFNQYRNGDDSMGRHADNEKELGEDPVVASVSLGVPRRFVMRSKQEKEQQYSLMLEHGSLFLMESGCQLFREHALPKTISAHGVRVNLTFRKIII